MVTRNVVLGDHQHALVEALVESGRFQNASEVLREGLRLLERQETEDAARLAILRRAADSGWSDLAGGHFVDLHDDELDGFLEQLGPRAVGTNPAG